MTDKFAFNPNCFLRGMTTNATEIPTLEELREVFDKRRPYFHIKNGRSEDGIFKLCLICTFKDLKNK